MFRRSGRHRSLALAAALAAVSVFASGQSGASAQQAALPAAKDVIARHVEAIGGEAAWKAIKSMRATGTFSLPAQALSGSLELMTAIYHSARSRAPVRLPLDPAHPLYGGWQPAPRT